MLIAFSSVIVIMIQRPTICKNKMTWPIKERAIQIPIPNAPNGKISQAINTVKIIPPKNNKGSINSVAFVAKSIHVNFVFLDESKSTLFDNISLLIIPKTPPLIKFFINFLLILDKK